jgi:hypothetical protein
VKHVSKKDRYWQRMQECERAGSTGGWGIAVAAWAAFGGGREVDVGQDFHQLLIDEVSTRFPHLIAPTGELRVCGIPVVIRENLPIADEV